MHLTKNFTEKEEIRCKGNIGGFCHSDFVHFNVTCVAAN